MKRYEHGQGINQLAEVAQALETHGRRSFMVEPALSREANAEDRRVMKPALSELDAPEEGQGAKA